MGIILQQTKILNFDASQPAQFLEDNPRRVGWVLIWHSVSSMAIQFGNNSLPMTTFTTAPNPFVCSYRDYGPLVTMRCYLITGGFCDIEIDELLTEPERK